MMWETEVVFKVNSCWISPRMEGDLLYGGLELLTQDSEDRDNVITEGLYCSAFKTEEVQALDTGGCQKFPQCPFHPVIWMAFKAF